MKVWTVLPEFLPDKLLQRQHQTLHAVLNGVVRRKAARGVTRFLRYGGFVVWLHHLAVEEMGRRGWHHETPVGDLWARLPADQRRLDYPVTAEMVRTDIAELVGKLRSGSFVTHMTGATYPVQAAGMQLVEAQRRLVITGRLPDGALYL